MHILQKLAILLGITGGLGLGVQFGPRLLDAFESPLEYTGHGSAVEDAKTVREQALRADLIVRVVVDSTENRVLSAKLPMYAEDAQTIIGYRESRTPFTDSTMEGLETFKGDSESMITVLQTGGKLDNGPTARSQAFAMFGDPIFKVGDEHILFLVDISGDGVHSVDRQLYRAVNTWGRYEIRGDGSLHGPESPDTIDGPILAQLPHTEEALLREIALSVPTSE